MRWEILLWAIFGKYNLTQRTLASPYLTVREDGKHSKSGMELKHSPIWMRLGQGRKGGMWTFGKVVTAISCGINENQATG